VTLDAPVTIAPEKTCEPAAVRMATLWGIPASSFENAIRNAVPAGTFSALGTNPKSAAFSPTVTATGRGVGFGVGLGVGFGVGAAVGGAVGFGVSRGVGAGVGLGVGVGAGFAVGAEVAAGDGLTIATGVVVGVGGAVVGRAVGAATDGEGLAAAALGAGVVPAGVGADPPHAARSTATATATARNVGRGDARMDGSYRNHHQTPGQGDRARAAAGPHHHRASTPPIPFTSRPAPEGTPCL